LLLLRSAQDLIRRWCYPVVPDNLPAHYSQTSKYTYSRHYVYRETTGNTNVERSTRIKTGCVIGRDCVVGGNNSMKNAVIGNKVVIGDNCTVSLIPSPLALVKTRVGAHYETNIIPLNYFCSLASPLLH